MEIRKDEAYWRAHLAAIEREGLTTKAYADREGIAASSLYFWRKRIKREAQRTAMAVVSEPRPQFATVQVVCEAPTQVGSSLPCTLVVGPGLRLEMAALPDPCWLAATAAALSARSR